MPAGGMAEKSKALISVRGGCGRQAARIMLKRRMAGIVAVHVGKVGAGAQAQGSLQLELGRKWRQLSFSRKL